MNGNVTWSFGMGSASHCRESEISEMIVKRSTFANTRLRESPQLKYLPVRIRVKGQLLFELL